MVWCFCFSWRDETPEDNIKFEVQVSNDSRNFRNVGEVIERGDKKDYSFVYPNPDCGKLFFRLHFEGKYSDVRTVTIPCDFTVITSTQSLKIDSKYPGRIDVLNMLEQRIFSSLVSRGHSDISLSVPRGIYLIRFVGQNGAMFNQKLFIQ